MKNFATSLSTLAVAITLASCGGSSDSNFPSNDANLQTTLVTPTYPTGSEELAAFYAINTFRNNMGLGYWEQSALLDQAAQNHMKYSITNDPTFQEDLEVEGKKDFTGTTPSKRAIYVGYFVMGNTLTETNVPLANVGELYATGPGANVVDFMINTIYHRSGLLTQSTRQIGLARDTTGVAPPNTHWWFKHGHLDGGQSVASNYLSFYPRDQQTNVPLSMTPEYPSVYSNQSNFNFATQTTSPVSFTASAKTALTVNSFTVTPAGSDTPLEGNVWTFRNDPNLASSDFTKGPISLDDPPAPAPTIAGYEAYWVGTKPFEKNTTYNVVFKGSTYLIERGATKEVNQSWSFTTGS